DVGFLFASISASGVRMSHPEGFPEGETIAIRDVQLECGLGELMNGTVKGRLIGEGVQLTILKKGDRTTLDGLGGDAKQDGQEEKQPEGERPPLDLEIDLSGCDFTYHDLDTQEKSTLKNVGLNAHLKGDQTDAGGRVRITMDELDQAPVVLRNVQIGARADGTKFVIDEASGQMKGGGTLSATGALDLADASSWTAKLDATKVQLDATLVPLVATFWPFASSAGGQLQGALNAEFALNGKGVTWDAIRPTLSGTGKLRLDDLALPPESIAAQIANAAGGKFGKNPIPLNSAGAEFAIADNWVSFNRLSATSDEKRLDMAGRVSLEGKLDLNVDLVPIAKAFGFGDIADKVETLPVRIDGTTEKPKVNLPKAEDLLRDKLKDALKDPLKGFR
ncbi:MAG: AsmA-like C-terminal region-containing protein, partial [Planctomycetota bacterium]